MDVLFFVRLRNSSETAKQITSSMIQMDHHKINKIKQHQIENLSCCADVVGCVRSCERWVLFWSKLCNSFWHVTFGRQNATIRSVARTRGCPRSSVNSVWCCPWFLQMFVEDVISLILTFCCHPCLHLVYLDKKKHGSGQSTISVYYLVNMQHFHRTPWFRSWGSTWGLPKCWEILILPLRTVTA